MKLDATSSDIEITRAAATSGPANDKSRDFVHSLEGGLAVIRAFNADRPSLTVSEIAQMTGLTRVAAPVFVKVVEASGNYAAG